LPKRPSVTTRCVADRYHGPTERIVEFGFPDGKGGLIAFSTDLNGENVIDVYRADQPLRVRYHEWKPLLQPAGEAQS